MYSDKGIKKINTFAVIWSAINFVTVLFFDLGAILSGLSGVMFGWALAMAYFSHNIHKSIANTFKEVRAKTLQRIEIELKEDIEEEVERRVKIRLSKVSNG
jgi:membrane associated rhomboid family serine protease